MNDLLKIRRGDVFYCRQTYQNNGSIENKTRPVVVVSNNKGNTTSTTCVVCPITTREKAVIPSQVLYFNGSAPQVVLCEQIKTVLINDLEKYIGYLSENVMKQVDRALQIQLGIEYELPDRTYSISEALKFIESSFENVLKLKSGAANNKEKISEDQMEDVALRIAQMVEDLVVPSSSKSIVLEEDSSKSDNYENNMEDSGIVTTKEEEEVSSTSKISSNKEKKSLTTKTDMSNMSQIEKFNSRYGSFRQAPTTKNSESNNTNIRKPGKRGKYFSSESDMRQFLDDCNKMSISEVCTKYNMDDPKKVYNHKYLCKRKLEDL